MSDLELADDAALVVFGVARLLAAVQLKRVQPFLEAAELKLSLQLVVVDL